MKLQVVMRQRDGPPIENGISAKNRESGSEITIVQEIHRHKHIVEIQGCREVRNCTRRSGALRRLLKEPDVSVR